MAGEADAVLRRIGRFAEGWIDSFSPPDSMRQIIGQLRHYTREARGTDAPIEIARQFYISLAETREAAQANLAASLPNAKPTPATRRREGAEAITDDLTTDLPRITGMFVIARNTAFTYRNQPVDAKQIDRELGVRYLLEGGVQRSGNQVRINSQLIDAESDAH